MIPILRIPFAGIFSFMMAVLVADLVGADNMATAFGLALTASGIGTGVGTPAGGKFKMSYKRESEANVLIH